MTDRAKQKGPAPEEKVVEWSSFLESIPPNSPHRILDLQLDYELRIPNLMLYCTSDICNGRQNSGNSGDRTLNYLSDYKRVKGDHPAHCARLGLSPFSFESVTSSTISFTGSNSQARNRSMNPGFLLVIIHNSFYRNILI